MERLTEDPEGGRHEDLPEELEDGRHEDVTEKSEGGRNMNLPESFGIIGDIMVISGEKTIIFRAPSDREVMDYANRWLKRNSCIRIEGIEITPGVAIGTYVNYPAARTLQIRYRVSAQPHLYEIDVLDEYQSVKEPFPEDRKFDENIEEVNADHFVILRYSDRDGDFIRYVYVKESRLDADENESA